MNACERMCIKKGINSPTCDESPVGEEQEEGKKRNEEMDQFKEQSQNVTYSALPLTQRIVTTN